MLKKKIFEKSIQGKKISNTFVKIRKTFVKFVKCLPKEKKYLYF